MIVVMCILGILAAIIVPMIGHYVTDAKIASANSSASNIKKNITYFLMELDLEMKGMKRIENSIAQFMFMCKNGQWIVKAECKTKVNGKSDTDGSLTFYDHKNWWNANKAFLLKDTTSKKDTNHMLGMARVVADTLVDLRTGFVMAFFKGGVCRGVVYIPNCDYLWPSSYSGIPNDLTKNRLQERPRIVKSSNTDKQYNCLKEFSPWAGVWPEVASGGIWDGQAGLDRDGFVVGTCPVIGYDSNLSYDKNKK